MSEVFADAFFYIALLNPANRFHPAALDALRNLQAQLVTTQWVLMEVGDALSAPAIRRHAHRFLDTLGNDPNTLIVPADMIWYRRGLALFGNRRDKSWSLTDCISFEVMRERAISDALTGDQHFVQAGFRLLLMQPPAR